MSPIRGPRLLLTFKQQIDAGRISVVLDGENEDWHVDAAPKHDGAMLRTLIRRLEAWGYTPIPEDECEPDLLDGGVVRIYFNTQRGAIAG